MSYHYNLDSIKVLDNRMQGNMEEAYQSFLKRVPKNGIILDVGCGSGRDSLYFKEKGHMVISTETSEELCQKAGEYIGQAVLFCRVDDIHFKLPLDGIWACGSLINLDHETLIRVLKHLHCYLKDSGMIYASFMYGDYEGERNDNFYLDLQEARAEEVFTEAGFNVEKMWISEHPNEEDVDIKWLNILANKK